MTINFILVSAKFYSEKATPLDSWIQNELAYVPLVGDQVILKDNKKYDVKSRIFSEDHISIYVDPDSHYA